MNSSHDAKVRIAQIGCGYWGPNLLRNLVQSTSADVVGLADSSDARRAYVAKTYPNIPVFDRADDVIGHPGVDAVVIATPAASHGDLVARALDAGKHVLVEKPLCFDEDESLWLLQRANKSNLVLAIGHVYLYHPYVRHLRARLNAGEFGNLVYLDMSRLNLGIVRSDVNVWWNLAPHDISIALYLRDGMMPETIVASGVAHLQPGIEDVVFATLTWSDGVRAHVHVSWLEPEKTRRMTLVAAEKMAVFDDTSPQPLTIYDKGVDVVPASGERMDYDNFSGPSLVLRDGDVERPDLGKGEPLALEIEDFLNAVLHDTATVADGQHARDVTRILACGQRSLNMGGARVRISAK